MTVELIIEFGKLIFFVASTALASGWVVTVLTQVLKWKLIAAPALKYPTLIAAILSFILAIPAVYLTGLIEVAGWASYVVMGVSSLFVATQSYDTIKKAILQLAPVKEIE